MNYWLLADTHFGHTKMQEYCGRPEGFEEKILKNLRNTTQPGDVVIHLGDVCIGHDEKWHAEIYDATWMCKRWLLRGNHDRQSLSWYLRFRWDCVADEIAVAVFGKRVVFSHRPLTGEHFDLNIHGHHHNTGHHPEDETTTKNRLIFMEHDYKPINLRRIVEG